MTCTDVHVTLFAFLDEELDAVRRDSLKVHLAGCRDCSREAEIEATIQERLRATLLDDELSVALDALDPMTRQLILLSKGFDLDYRNVGAVLGCTAEAAASRMAGARRELRERLEELSKDGKQELGGLP